MPGQATTSNGASLQQRWQQWTCVIESVTQGRAHIDFETYHKLHEGLLQECWLQAGAAEAEKKSFYQGLERLAKPWLSPETLARADQEILREVLARCHQAEQKLGCRKRILSTGQWL